MNFLAGWKTVLFNVLSIALVVLGSEPIKELIDPETLAAIVAAVNLVLRFFTATPIFKAKA